MGHGGGSSNFMNKIGGKKKKRLQDDGIEAAGDGGEMFQMKIPGSETFGIVQVEGYGQGEGSGGEGGDVLVCGTEEGGLWGWDIRCGRVIIGGNLSAYESEQKCPVRLKNLDGLWVMKGRRLQFFDTS
ncbi:hypothetical protein HK100_007245 [Physocladia obscura]|uniref:Uncharacterized protein n=1 Tax=Physocladia obscura TaxID=109957 RepID=A0AAD5SRX2_9FUNG|nr:hypothetical protein HK100_007245 [Physocladia obscura]